MTHAFGLGVTHTLHALAYLGGVLAVLLWLAVTVATLALVLQPFVRDLRIRVTAHRLHRAHSRSGRA